MATAIAYLNERNGFIPEVIARPVLSIKTKPAMENVVNRLEDNQAEELESDLFEAGIALYGGGNWQRIIINTSVKLHAGGHFTLSENLDGMTKEKLHRVCGSLLESRGIET